MSPKKRFLRPVIAGLIALTLLGCASSQDEVEKRVSEEYITGLLQELVVASRAQVNIAAGEMRSANPDPELQRHAINWQLSTIAGTRYARGLTDPRAGLLNLWARSHQMLETVKSDFGREYFGAQHPIALRASEDVVRVANGKGKALVGESRYTETLTLIQEFARDHSIRNEVADGQARPGILSTGASAVKWVLTLPMKPFDLGAGVGETAQSVQNVAEAASRGVAVASDMPDTIRLESELFLLNLSRVETITRALDDMDRVTRSIESFEKTAATLPEDVRKELTVVLDEIDSNQTEIRKTLDHARGLISEASTVMNSARANIEEVNRVVADTKTTAESLQPVVADLTAAGQAWEQTANAVTHLIETANGPEDDKPKAAPGTAPKEPAPPAEPERPSPNVIDYGNTAEKLTATAVQLRGLTEDIQALIASKELTSRLENVDSLAADTVDHVTWRAIQLCIAFFGCLFGSLFAYKLAAMKYLRPRSGATGRQG